MARKRKPARAKRKEIPDEEWQRWGERFGKRMGRQFRDFGDEVGQHGTRLGNKGRAALPIKGWWHRTFGPMGPFFQSIIGIICIGVGIVIINIVNEILASTFVSGISFFLAIHLPVFFVLMLFFNYLKFVYGEQAKARPVLKPLEAAAGATVAIWLIAWGLLISYHSSGIGFFGAMAGWVFTNLWGIFTGLLVIAYVIAIIIRSGCRCCGRE